MSPDHQIQVTPKQSPTSGGYAFEGVGLYEKIVGKAFGELDPKDPKNAVIVNIQLAPKNANGNTPRCHGKRVGRDHHAAGDLVFWGDQNRRLRAFDADDGKVLWEAVVAGMVMNSTISYAVNGKQYVMVFTGEGQSVTAGPLGLTKDTMPPAVRRHNSIFAFALP